MCVYCGVQKFNKAIVSRIVFEAEEADAVLRRPYPQTARLGR